MERKMRIIFSALAAAVFVCSGFASCAWREAADSANRARSNFAQHIGQNRRVVVLPFEADEANPQLASKVRESFYSHFTPKKYYDVELRDIDAMLDHIDALSGKGWGNLSPMELGRCFKADYLFYGRVLSTRRLFFIFYSQLAMNVEVRLVETQHGRTVWKSEIEKQLQSGDLPLHPFSIIPAAVRTGVDVSDQRMQDLIERTCRELAQRVPEPEGEHMPSFKIDIQVASFSSGDRAREMLQKLEDKGYMARIEPVRINGLDWYRVLVGPYTASDGESAKQRLGADSTEPPVFIYAR
jgi:hypothetical protein